MDSIDFDDVKAEKSKALHRFQSLRSIGLFFRATEIGVALLFVFWIFTCLPFAVRISGEFLRRLAFIVSTPLFMFVLGNSIVVALFTTKSTVFSACRPIGDRIGAEADIYEKFIRSGENRVDSCDGDLTEEIVVYDDKQVLATETDSNSNSTVAREDHAILELKKDLVSVTESAKDHHHTKIYRRSKSEISTNQSSEMAAKPSLRRSETAEKCRKIVESREESPFPEDNLSNEEFQKTIEAFIAKEIIFRRRESLAVVIHG
ncbi:unnamed protein product [Cochlearia groenlandica]